MVGLPYTLPHAQDTLARSVLLYLSLGTQLASKPQMSRRILVKERQSLRFNINSEPLVRPALPVIGIDFPQYHLSLGEPHEMVF